MENKLNNPKLKLLAAVLAVFFVSLITVFALQQSSDLTKTLQAPVIDPSTHSTPSINSEQASSEQANAALILNNEKQLKRIASNQKGKFNFAVFGDSQQLNNDVIKKILKDVDGKDIQFSIQDGDLVPEGIEENYQNFYDVIKTFKTPYLALPGNHDVNNCGETNFKKYFGKLYYSFSYSNSLFILLNNSTGTVSDTQLEWLEIELKKDYKHMFVFMHKPLFNPDEKINHCMEDQEKAKKIMELLEKYKADIAFSGHIHSFYDQTKNGVEYITSGGAGGGLSGENSFHHYLKISVDGDKIEKEVIKI